MFDAAFPTLLRKNTRNLSPEQLCDRDKRDVHYSDDPTEEDFQLFQQTPQLRDRIRRGAPVGPVSKENATRYCAERISETKIGKLCAKMGVNVQALVNTCSADVEVSKESKFLFQDTSAIIIDSNVKRTFGYVSNLRFHMIGIGSVEH